MGDESRLLFELEGDERRRAAAVFARCPRIRLEANRPYACDDLPEAVVFVVEQGNVLVWSGTPSRRLVLAVAGDGSLLVPPAADENLTALSRTRLTVVHAKAHDALLLVPGAARALTSGLIDALADREESLANFARHPIEERIRAKLLQLACSHGKVASDGVVVDLPLTHDLLAEMIGSARETVTRSVQELMRAGFVTRERARYRLNVGPCDLARLRRS